MIAGLDAVEAAGLVGDDAGEHVEPAGRAFRIGGGGNVVGQRQAFLQRHDIDATGFQHRAVGEREFVQLQVVDALRHRGRARQEARAHAVGNLAKAQVEARRLDLAGHERARRQDAAIGGKLADHAVGQDALVLNGEGKCHGAPLKLEARSNPTGGLTGRRAPARNNLSRGQFEPAGLQPR